jgi:hypothetical protein
MLQTVKPPAAATNGNKRCYKESPQNPRVLVPEATILSVHDMTHLRWIFRPRSFQLLFHRREKHTLIAPLLNLHRNGPGWKRLAMRRQMAVTDGFRSLMVQLRS